MKAILLVLSLSLVMHSFPQPPAPPNIFIITTDGFRWQEIFEGADSAIINNASYVKDTALLKQLYWSNDLNQRRKLLMPFVWNIINRRGSLYGNRNYENEVSVENPYRFSYAGYSEIFTGYADRSIIANKKKYNSNQTVLEFLVRQPEYKNKVAAFASWNLFEYIFRRPSGSFYLNSGYRPVEHDSLSAVEILANGVQQFAVNDRLPTRNDMLTFVTAKEYIQTKHPKVVFIGFGETDEFAHHGEYDGYLQSAHSFDSYLSQLWYLINSDPFYKNNTSIIITTDHGRGKKENTWTKHDMFTQGSSNTWLLTLGPGMPAKGEVKNKEEIFNNQIAQTIAHILGFEYTDNHPVSEPVYTISR